MTKEEIEHEKLWTEGIVSAVMLSSKGIVRDFISNLEKVGYKIVKAESENERLKSELLGNTEQLKAEMEWIREKMIEKFNSLECQYNGKDTKKNRYWAGFGDAIVAFDNALLDLTNGLPQPPKQ